MIEKDIIRNKIKIFISSQCGIPKYDHVREKLKALIEQTSLAEVYLFEDGLASTQTAEQEYLYSLEDSDVCIFLIDNADGVTPAVIKEIERAKALSKQALYLFCDEFQKDPTQIQKELMGAKGTRFYVTSSFNDFIEKGYQSLINDIATIYRYYCDNRLVDPEFSEKDKFKIEFDSTTSDWLTKGLLKGLDRSKDFITGQIHVTKRKIEETGKLDEYCTDFLHVLFGKRGIREFNTSLLLELLKSEQSEKLYNVVEIRWKAIQNYWQGDLEGCISFLNDALEVAKKNSLPHCEYCH